MCLGFRLIESLPLQQVQTYANSITEFAALPEDELEDIVSQSMEAVINEPIESHWEDGFKVVKIPDSIDVFGDQVYRQKKC